MRYLSHSLLSNTWTDSLKVRKLLNNQRTQLNPEEFACEAKQRNQFLWFTEIYEQPIRSSNPRLHFKHKNTKKNMKKGEKMKKKKKENRGE